MAQYLLPYPYSCLSLPQLGLGGILNTCNPRGPTQSPQTTRQRYAKNWVFSLSAKSSKVWQHEEMIGQYPHPQPFSCLVQTQLGLGRNFIHLQPQSTPSDPPKQAEIRPKQETYVKHIALMRN